MKFDFAIGNPAYQDTADYESNFAPPIYNKFLDAAYEIADKVEMITPGRFLFDTGATPSEWNKRMLNDDHLKVLYFEQDSSKVFSNTDIKGGVAITYRDSHADFGKIGIFTVYPELNTILRKIAPVADSDNLAQYTNIATKFNLEALNAAVPKLKRTDKRIGSNAFSIPVFHDKKQADDVLIEGVISNKRTRKAVNKKYIDEGNSPSLYKYKVFVSKANGTGAFGEVLAPPIIAAPGVGNTHTFVSIGMLETENEAKALNKYIKTKFLRTMLGILKITQDNMPGKWKLIPMQDFTDKSDINWNTSIKKIDQQLYKKYNLTNEEIDFIETHVKEME